MRSQHVSPVLGCPCAPMGSDGDGTLQGTALSDGATLYKTYMGRQRCEKSSERILLNFGSLSSCWFSLDP